MLEDLIESVGSSGKFQIMVVLLVTLPMTFMAMSMLVMAYGGMVTDWWCLPDGWSPMDVTSLNSTSIYYQNCTEPSSCTRTYEAFTRTVVSEFDLVCDRAWIKPTVTSIQMGGVLLGAFVGGQSGDTFGRKKTLYFSIFLQSVANVIAGFSVNWQMFAALRFFIGISLGCYLVMVNYTLEFVGLKRRALASLVPFWTLGAALLPLAAYLIHDWKMLHFGIGAVTFPFLLGWLIVPESLRWLTTKDRLKEAKRILEQIARTNGKTVPGDADKILSKVAELEKSKTAGEKRYTYLDLFRTCKMFRTSICLEYAWFVCSSVYYGFSFGISSFSGNFYLNFFLMNVIELTTYLPVIYLVGKLGRRNTCATSFFLSASACVATLIVQEVNDVSKSPLITGLSLTAQVLVSAAWSSAILLTSESYPTVIRYVGIGACSSMARVGGMLAPFIFNLSKNRMAPYIIIGVFLSVGGIAVMFLRETKDSAMQDLIHVKAEDSVAMTNSYFSAIGAGKDNKNTNTSVSVISGESEFTRM